MMQFDALASQLLSATGNVKEITGTANLGRTRIKSLCYVASVAGTLELRDGGASGTVKAIIPLGVTTTTMHFPGEGLLFQTDVHATIVGATVAGATFFYG